MKMKDISTENDDIVFLLEILINVNGIAHFL